MSILYVSSQVLHLNSRHEKKHLITATIPENLLIQILPMTVYPTAVATEEYRMKTNRNKNFLCIS